MMELSPFRGTRSTLVLAAAVGLLVLVGAAVLVLCGGSYIRERGFPLDDAWIHAVYGRELARTGMLAYNPGEPATGETSILWGVLAAIAHVGAPSAATAVARLKWIGFGFHAAAAVAIACGALARGAGRTASLVAAALVLFQPHLLAASVSGMEVPLASLVAVGLTAAAARGTPLQLGAVSAVAPLARPELAFCSLSLSLLMPLAPERSRLRAVLAAAAGTGLCFLALAVRNLALTGLPLPATFYAKFGVGGAGPWSSETRGFGLLLPRLSVLLHPVVVISFGLACVVVLARRSRDPRAISPSPAAAAILTAIAFFAVSFVAAPPVDPEAFYHQRYCLPLLTLYLAGVPLFVAPFLAASSRLQTAGFVLAVLFVAGEISLAPSRFRRLENDARNIDDVQVSVGLSLRDVPAATTVWAVDAGAIRYFGAARVVDMLGLNAPALLGGEAQRFLDSRPPAILEAVPTWSDVRLDTGPARDFHLFAPSTSYTVTSYPQMAVHRLVRCPPGTDGTYFLRAHAYRFACAP